MRVRSGWSTEFAKKKFDVELEEDRDLPQLLDDKGIGRERAGELLLRDKFMLLWDEAELISATTDALEKGVKPEQSPKALAVARRQEATIVRVKVRLGILREEELVASE